MKPATRLSFEIILLVSGIVIVMNLPRLYAAASSGDSSLIQESVIRLVLALLATPLIFGVFWFAAKVLAAKDRFAKARRSSTAAGQNEPPATP